MGREFGTRKQTIEVLHRYAAGLYHAGNSAAMMMLVRGDRTDCSLKRRTAKSVQGAMIQERDVDLGTPRWIYLLDPPRGLGR